jgi:hypothetical protein
MMQQCPSFCLILPPCYGIRKKKIDSTEMLMSFIMLLHSCGYNHIKMVILMMVMLEINMIFCVVISCLALYSRVIWFESQQG